MAPTTMQDHIRSTYFMLRNGLAVLAFGFPLLLGIGGCLFGGLPLQASMSAYYHSGDGIMRDEFVGIMIAVSFFLILYKGFTYFENYAFNLAGIFLIGVALVPMEWGCGDACSRLSAHGAFSVLFFLCIAYVCIFRASDTLGLMNDPDKEKRFHTYYRWIGAAMIGSPLVAVIASFLVNPSHDQSQPRSITFFLEATCIYVFGAYWVVKSIEIGRTKSDKLAMEGRLITREYRPKDVFSEIKVESAP